ncbi:MAG: hypothetical protein DRN27_05395 [Thermoplasmata archaeon]|nr:MAG: hypothetical protein DRN27_05395 [Thermoplasmata archaeon]
MYANPYALPGFIAFILNLILGSYILSRNPKHRQNQVFFFITFTFILCGLGEAILRSSNNQSEAFIGPILFYLGAFLLPPFNLHFSLLFPDKKKLTKKTQYMIFMVYLIGIIGFILFLFQYQPIQITTSSWGYRYPITSEVITIFIALWLFIISLLAFINYFINYRKTTDPIKQKQIRNVFISISFIGFIAFLTNIIPSILQIQIFPFATLSMSIYTFFIASSILEYSLFIYIPMSQTVLNKHHIHQLNRDELEKEVNARTQALLKTNEDLRAEIKRRSHAEKGLTESLDEKNMLLKEVHHRVKNNLQIISSLLYLQDTSKNKDNATDELRNRIRSMSLIHERLYRSKNLSEINLKEYLTELIQALYTSYGTETTMVQYNIIDESDVNLDIDTAIPCGLIINEIISNSLKHAFPHNNEGKININIKKEDKNLILTINDNGIGLPDKIKFTSSKTLGMQLIKSLVKQLNGTIKIQGEGKTEYILQLPDQQKIK